MARTLLVADKSIVIQKSVGITFAQEDFKVAYANDGEEALSRMRQMKPDCLLVHTGIPKRDGYAVCEAVKNDPQLNKTPVLLLVGTHEAYDEAKGKAVKADGYVIKPFESQALIDRVYGLLAGGGVPVATPASQVETAVSKTPAPPIPSAAPRPAAPQPSPAATIAGQMPRQAPVATPTPQVTAPMAPEPKRDAPLLDMEPVLEDVAPAPVEDVFDFSFEEAPQAEASVDPAAAVPSTPTAPTPEAPIDYQTSPQPIQTAAEAANEGEFWDFSEETTIDAPAEEPSVGVEMAEPGIDLSAPAAEIAAEPEIDFGFNVSEDEAGEPTASFASPEEEVTPETLPEDGLEVSFGEMPGMEEEALPAGEVEFTPPSQVETIPLMDASLAGEPEETSAPIPSTGASVQLSPEQVEEIVTKVFRQVIERIAWEVVPDLAETIIKEELERLTKNAS